MYVHVCTSNLSDLDEGIIAENTAKLVGYGAAVDARVRVVGRGDLKDRTIGVPQLLVVLIPPETGQRETRVCVCVCVCV
jgi:hypothetical protein